jgi:hypothetical protein
LDQQIDWQFSPVGSMGWSVRFCVRPKSYQEPTMQNDPIVEEMRKNGQDFTARYNHDLVAIFKALKEKEQSLGRKVVQRSPRYLPGRVAS